MKVIYNREFNFSYCPDPAAASGRMECIVNAIQSNVTLVHAISAEAADIAACHSARHIEYVKKTGLYDIASLAAGAAVLAADTALSEPSFALIRPPGHHASFDSSWGFCYFNNMAIAISKLKRENRIHKAFILDIDLHFGDGTVNILQHENYVSICNPTESDAGKYLLQIERNLPTDADIIGVSAGFDNHLED
ncbi:MAG: histone deacetylase family protein [Syntrophales bacterium]|jgi:acetoin utilization deacetylase AcuC-like enzyme|nr:histone deacetylase family protein [Syntrophales bacterium]MDY0044784.1 histone deacetylase family protein [Syntrophales bacterium]